MAEPAKRNATYEDVLALPDDERGAIIFGALSDQPDPASPHGSALRDGAWIHPDPFNDDEEFRAPPFNAVALRQAELWPMPPAASPSH